MRATVPSASERNRPQQGGEAPSTTASPQAQLEAAEEEQMASIPPAASSIPALLPAPTASSSHAVTSSSAPLSTSDVVVHPLIAETQSSAGTSSSHLASTLEVPSTLSKGESQSVLLAQSGMPSSPSSGQAFEAASPSSGASDAGSTGSTAKAAAPMPDDAASKARSAVVSTDPEGATTPVQLLSVLGLQKRFDTNLDLHNPRQSPGLSEKAAAERLQRDGPNALTPPKETPEIIKYLSHYGDPFMLLLILCGILSCIAYAAQTDQIINLWIGVVLFVVVVISSTFAYVQSGKASAVMKAFKNMLPKMCHVVRDGRVHDIAASALVVGDVVRIGGGDQVPADLRLIYCDDLKVEVSSLTGESLPISCTTTSKEAQTEEAKNVCFPEHDTRVLTDAGFLFVSEIEERIAAGQLVRYACYEEATGAVVYSPGTLVFSPPPRHWVDFTQGGTRRAWDATSDEYGATVPSGHRHGNHVTLRTTPNHNMYVQLCSGGEADQLGYRPRAAAGLPIPPHKMRAVEMAPGFQCSCAVKGVECTHGYSAYRLFTGAPAGVAVDNAHATTRTVASVADHDAAMMAASPCTVQCRSSSLSISGLEREAGHVAKWLAGHLGLRDSDEIDAFLELFGYWLGVGSMSHSVDGRAVLDAVTFSPKMRDRDYLCELLRRLHLVEGVDYTMTETDMRLQVRITAPRWCRWFDAQFGIKNALSTPCDNNELALTKQRHPVAARSAGAIRNEVGITAATSSDELAKLRSVSIVQVDDEEADAIGNQAAATRLCLPTSSSLSRATTELSTSPSSSSRVLRSDTVDVTSDSDDDGEHEWEPLPRAADSTVDAMSEDDAAPAVFHSLDDSYDDIAKESVAKWLPDWALFGLSKAQLRLVIEGLCLADGHSAPLKTQQEPDDGVLQRLHCIFTSSVGFRDQLVRACLHAGYSAYFFLNHRAGHQTGYHAVPVDGSIYSQEEMEAALQVDPTRLFRPVGAKYDQWTVQYAEETSELLAAHDIRYDGQPLTIRRETAYGKGYVAVNDSGKIMQADTQSTLAELLDCTVSTINSALLHKHKHGGQWRLYTAQEYEAHVTGEQPQDQAAVATELADAYDAARDGRVWCVRVEHEDHLIFAQRAHKDARGVVTKVGSPLIVGNCFNSSQCLEGEAIGVVYATGDRTLIGKIAHLASQTTTVDTTLQREVKGFVKKLTVFSFFLGILFFIIGLARKQPAINAFINGFIVVLIANVPEGLPVTVVTILTITGRRLAALNVFVKELASVETLGSATVIATDKTGTLTQNKMAVSRLWFDLTPMTVETVYRDLGPSTLTMHPSAVNRSLYSGTATLRAIERVCAVCSRTRFADHRDLSDEEARMLEQNQALRQLDPSMTLRSAKAAYPQFLSMLDSNLTINSAKRQALTGVKDDSKRDVIGDASETALFNFIRARQSIELVRYHNRVVFDVPFNSRNKYALTIMKPYGNHHGSSDHRRILLMKGAPEIVLERCSRWMNRGKVQPIDDEFKEAFQLAYETFGGFGERVLGFAQLELEEKDYPPEMDTKYSQKDENYPTKDLVFLGLISLVDPPKETVPGAIAMCRSAGVRVVMVTGDHPLTAAAIARQVGIITTNTRDELAKIRGVPIEMVNDEEADAIVIRGSELDKWQQADWDRALTKAEVVFARTTPSQKLQIVENLQRLGNIVAVTGDGVNDSPALKKADIGVAMGISGSDVARDAGDVILMDDDFSSIVVGIREGRTIFDNLTKTIAYTITHMVPEVVPILMNLAFGFPLGLNAILILCIDIGTELAPAISLAYEKAESDVMSRPPRNANKDHLVTAKTVTYWYFLAGAWETLSCYLAYFLVFNHFGVPPDVLPFSDSYWNNPGSNPTFYVGSTSFSSSDQQYILAQVQTAYWVTLTGAQVAHIWFCKTRVLSVWQHGWFDNVVMDYGVALEIAIILIIALIPPDGFFNNNPFPGFVWAILLVAWAGLFILNEPRKWLIRNVKGNKFVDFLAW